METGAEKLSTEDGDTAMDTDETSQTSSPINEQSSINEDSGNKDKVYKKNSHEEQRQREFDDLLFKLNFKDKDKDNYVDKLTTANFLKIGPSIKKHQTDNDIAYTFLQKLLMLDYRARDTTVTVDSTNNDTPDNHKIETDLYDYLANLDSDQSTKQCKIHPMDVQMALFHCSDSFLRQSMITKLSQCQYALPLFVPDPVTRDIECPLWTFRPLRKSWKVTDNYSGAVTIKNMAICQAETPMVSFFRLGSVSSSKSQVINYLINDRQHTFFHRDSKGATKSRCLIDGMVEIAWYFPAGKDNDNFSDCVAFCNLHGDALSHEKQLGIMIDKASVNVVLLPTLVGKGDDKIKTILNDLKKKPLIFLLADKDFVAKEIHQGMYTMGVKDKSQSDVAKELKDIIRIILSSEYTSFKLENMGKVSGIKTDEDVPACQEGKSAAVKIQKLLEGNKFSQIKDTFLPCQGKLWHEWCQTHKELFHLRGERDKCQKQERLQEIRRKQLDKPSSELVQMFIENLQSLKLNEKLYFLKWNELFLDNLFSDNISEINQKYEATLSEFLALKKNKEKHGMSDELEAKKMELEEVSNKLQSASVGVEHILRELGQIYEANAACIDIEKVPYAQYPKLAAELVIAGHPMELMDGDAAHVPLAWITGVLDEVINTLGDKRVFVLSILGIQSSGKSTMLNAMFGLQFAVSAGRCTRGAFMQLVEVSEEIQKDFKFDYVLVVDTEGLRAPELAGRDTRRHDNALTTFVIGLANMTLINIYGENQSEMEDVLHIAVQAFMRMKQVKLSPSCLFVHQNVAAIDACENNKVGKRHLEEKLDEMTKLAAEEEEFDAEFFSEVIAFDVETDVKYFAQLWEGSPPMAPPNPGYSESIQELKKMILSKASQSNGITFSEFSNTIKDIWNALLSENFVFSFKNTMEISLYRKLEVEYSKWTWALRQEMLKIECQLHIRIENGRLDRINTSDLNKEMIKTWEEVEMAMKKYFDEGTDKDVLVQWKTQFENKIKDFHNDQVRGAKQKLEEIIQQRKARKKMDDMTKVCEDELLQRSKEIARTLKSKANDETELEKEFNTLWKGWVTDFTEDVPPITEINIQNDVDSILNDMGYEWSLICSRKSSYKDKSKQGNYSDNTKKLTTVTNKIKKNAKIAFQKGKDFFSSKKELSDEVKGTIIDNVEIQTNILIKDKPVNTNGYHTSYMHEVIKHVEEHVKDFEHTSAYALTKKCKVDILLHVCTNAKDFFQNAHDEFQKINDVHSYFENQREQYYNAFKSFCKGNSSAAVLGELLCSKLKASAIQLVYDKTALGLGGEMKCSHPPFSGNRVNLEKHVLTSLAEKEVFNRYINYIKYPQTEVKLFIKESVEEYITTNKDTVLSIMKKHTDDISRRLSQAVHDATEKVKTQSGNANMWLEEFSSPLQDDLRVVTTYDHINDIDDFDFLKEEIKKGLASMVEDLNNLPINVVDVKVTPEKVLIDHLCNCCWVQCPFCKAICTHTLEDHSPSDHSVPFHRPSGINGWHRIGTDKLVIHFCTTSIASDRNFHPTPGSEESIPYKEYRKGGPEYAHWSITPDESKLKYWTWFVCKFQKELEDYYGMKFEGIGEIPEEWRKHTRQEAIQSLENM